jgi:hypothetical protein
MSGWNEELLASLATAPWQPQSIRAPRRESLPLRLRAGLLGAIVLLHLLGAVLLIELADRNRAEAVDDAIVVDFITDPPRVVEAPPLPNETITIRRPTTPAPAPRTPPTPRPSKARRGDHAMQVVEAPPRVELYNRDGSLRVPEDLLDTLDRKFGDKRQFSYQIPHMDDAKKYFERNPALVYEETRFEQYWTPDADALTALLTKLAEATTKEVKMKVPGTNGSYMVCKVSILALGGGCGVLTNGADWNGPQDDPNTLNPEEARQCDAWWEQIVSAKTQDAWRATKKLYERECRKPLLRAPSG